MGLIDLWMGRKSLSDENGARVSSFDYGKNYYLIKQFV